MSEHGSGFKQYTRVSAARSALLEAVEPLSRTDQVPLRNADERVAATTLTADRPVPHYERAAMDGYAVRARDTFEANERSPVALRHADSVEQLSGLLANLEGLGDEIDGLAMPEERS